MTFPRVTNPCNGTTLCSVHRSYVRGLLMLGLMGRIDPEQGQVRMTGRFHELTLLFPPRTRDDGADHGIAFAHETRRMLQ